MKNTKLENGEVIGEFRKQFTSQNKTMSRKETMLFEPTTTKIEVFITNALNQQRINLIKEILESKEVNALGLELPFPVWQSFKEFLTKLEK